jgi:hypothetical protein
MHTDLDSTAAAVQRQLRQPSIAAVGLDSDRAVSPAELCSLPRQLRSGNCSETFELNFGRKSVSSKRENSLVSSLESRLPLEMEDETVRQSPPTKSATTSMFEAADLNDDNHTSISGDGALLPPPYSGLPTENAHEWYNYFVRYIKYKRLAPSAALELFTVLLRGNAAATFSTLDRDVQSNHARVSAWFNERYRYSPQRKFRLGQELFMRKQGPSESVDDYFVAIQGLANQINERPSDDITRYAVMSGLRPNIAGHVMAFADKAATIDELLTTARAAELMTAATPDTSVVQTLIDEVKRLSDRIDTTTTRSVSRQSRSPSTERRHVAFTDRSPTPPPTQSSRNDRNGYNRNDYHHNDYNHNGYNNARPVGPVPPTDTYTSTRSQQSGQNNTRRCGNCARFHAPDRASCFAFNKSCYNCSQLHHLARCCRSRPNNTY